MELVEGATLRDVLRARGALGVPRAFAVMERVLSGLAAAHRLGLVHRDVKPENVLIGRAGEVKVADFGLAVAAAEAGASHAGTIMGTVAYLSPEQVTTGSADARSDVYAAGVLLYELLTGAPPFRGETAISVAYQHVTSEVPPPSRVATEVPEALDELVRTATRRDAAERPADAGALLAQLRRVALLLDVPVVAPPAPPPRPLEEQPTVPQAHRAAGPYGTRTFAQPGADGPDGPPGGGPRGTAALPAPPPGEREPRRRRRRRRRVVVGTVLTLVLVLLAGLGTWWLGNGRLTTMPSLVGLQQDTADRLLAQADLVPTTTTAYDDAAAAGLVLRTDPAAKARLARGSGVSLVVSRGRPTVPAVAAGTSVADAQAAVRAVQLDPVQSDGAAEYSATVPQGAVVRTDPGAGTALPLGGAVTLVISRGPQPVQQVRVPFVVGRRFAEAAAILADDGLKAEENPRFGAFGRTGGVVVAQSNGPGSMVDPGTTITLDTL